MTTHPTVYFARYADALPRLCVPSHLITARVKLNNCILHAPASHNGRVSLISCFQISCQWFTRCILTVTLLISCFQILCQVYQMYFQPSHCWFCVFKSCAWFTSCTLPVTLLISCFQILCMSHCWFHVFKTCAMFTRCILTVTITSQGCGIAAWSRHWEHHKTHHGPAFIWPRTKKENKEDKVDVVCLAVQDS